MSQTITETYVRDVVVGDTAEEDYSVDIQRSYLVPSDCDARLKPFGGRLLADQEFLDEYYDSSDYALSLQAITLRSRDGEWELTHQDPSEVAKNQPRTFRGPEEISTFLQNRHLLNNHATGGNFQEVQEALKAGGFSVFAKIVVVRKVYGIPAQKFSEDELFPAKVSFDTSDFGHSFGEIEVSVDHRDEIPAAMRTIEVLSQRLGFQSVTSAATHG